jgi:D-alanyl-D-alanine carboxypeptidase
MREMNKAAFDIASMQYSVFVNPHGLYHKNQYSCAYDLALLIQRCSSLKPITDVWGLANAEIAIKGPNSRVIKIISTVTPIVEGNPLAVGGKTGTLGKSRSLAMLYRDVENNYFSVVTINSNSLDERDAAHNRIINYFVNL